MYSVQKLPSHPLIVVFTGGKRRKIKTLNLEIYPSQQMVNTVQLSVWWRVFFKQKECKNLRLRLQGTRKLGCLTHISVKQYTLYPAYQITEKEKIRLGSRKLRQLREERLLQLREEIKSGSPSKEIRYFVSLPTRDAHTKHPTDEVSGYAQKVHPVIAQKISEFVSEGMKEVHEVKKALRQYVHTQFSQQYQCQPLPSDRAFHPSLHDLQNHVHKTKKSSRAF